MLRFALHLLGALGLFLAFSSQTKAYAAPVEIGSRFCVLANQGDLTPGQALARRAKFDCSQDALSRPANHIWLLADVSDLDGRFADPAIQLEMSFHGAMTVARVYEDGLQAQPFTPVELGRRVRVPAALVFPLLSETGAYPGHVLIGIDQVWDMTNWNTVFLVSDAASREAHLRNAITYSLMIGLLLTPLVLSAIVFPVLRYSFIPFHFGMLSCALIYGLSWSGLTSALPVTIEPMTRSYINHLSVPFAFLFACLLTRELCSRSAIGKFWSDALTIAGVFTVLGAMLIMFAAPGFSYYGSLVYYALFILPVATIVCALIRGSLNNKIICQLQLLAWSPMILYVIGRIGRGLGLWGEFALLEIGLFPALISEALLTTGVVAFRIHAVRKAHEHSLEKQSVLHGLANTDALTGALNRRAFIEHFQQQVAAGVASEKVLTLMLIDIDHFKQVNDTHGHAVGDDVLVRLTKLLKSQCRGEDVCARFGAEEFCILIATNTVADADSCAYRFKAAIADTSFPVAGTITASFGTITVTESTPAPFESWYTAADKALYVAKSKGRNRIQRSTWQPGLSDQGDEAYASGWTLKDQS